MESIRDLRAIFQFSSNLRCMTNDKLSRWSLLANDGNSSWDLPLNLMGITFHHQFSSILGQLPQFGSQMMLVHILAMCHHSSWMPNDNLSRWTSMVNHGNPSWECQFNHACITCWHALGHFTSILAISPKLQVHHISSTPGWITHMWIYLEWGIGLYLGALGGRKMVHLGTTMELCIFLLSSVRTSHW